MSLRTAVRCQIFVALALLLTFSSAAFAQDATPPKVDIFAGYSWATPGPVFFNTPRQGASGGAASLTYNLNKWLGATGDFQFNSSEKFHQVHFFVGPRLAARGDHFVAFVHALAGYNRIEARREIGQWFGGGGVMAGGGLDIPINKVGIRLIGGDYLYSHYPHESFGLGVMKGAGLRSGLVFSFGGGTPPVPVSASCAAQPTA